MSKPINPQLLFSVVEQQAGQTAADHTAPAPPQTFDRAALLDRVAGDEELMGDVIRLFLEECPRQMAAIRQAVAERRPEAIRITAHALKGAAGNLGANALFESSGMLERVGAESRLDAAEAAWRRLSADAANVIEALRAEISAGSGEHLCAR